MEVIFGRPRRRDRSAKCQRAADSGGREIPVTVNLALGNGPSPPNGHRPPPSIASIPRPPIAATHSARPRSGSVGTGFPADFALAFGVPGAAIGPGGGGGSSPSRPFGSTNNSAAPDTRIAKTPPPANTGQRRRGLRTSSTSTASG